ncbi:MAG: transcriptional regulator [Bacteroidales bacterium 36-12]|jgi:transcriptional regulator with XRE-family HTH domain|nr:MAG: transcriptional regulator [Bacteroidales bacterium 36-12]
MDLIEIGKQIRERRKELGLDQSTLATLANVGINALGRLERGTGNPRFDVLHSIAKTLGLDITVK